MIKLVERFVVVSLVRKIYDGVFSEGFLCSVVKINVFLVIVRSENIVLMILINNVGIFFINVCEFWV